MVHSGDFLIAQAGPGAGFDGALTVERLLLGMERLPAQPPVALRAIWACDDPRSDSRSVADALALDPVLAARVLRIANSAFYGVRSGVSRLDRAVTVVGLATVRAVAASCAARVDEAAPRSFWSHAAATGAACQLIAHRFGVSPNDAFTAGLIHDLGVPILEAAAPDAWQEAADNGGTKESELAILGITHPDAAARVLTAWRLPPALVEAVASHHDPLSSAEAPLARALIVADTLAAFAGFTLPGTECQDSDLQVLGLDGAAITRLVDRIASEAAQLTDVLAT